jgi:hypothetical protein
MPVVVDRVAYTRVFLFTVVYNESQFCPPFLENVWLRVRAQNLRNFALFNVDFKCRTCLSDIRASVSVFLFLLFKRVNLIQLNYQYIQLNVVSVNHFY